MQLEFTIKEFSKIVNISPRTLRYYGSIGLFNHSGIRKNGYRYFTSDKIEEIHIITYLRHMKIPIAEIKQHLKNRNIEEYSQILENQLKKITEEINNLSDISLRIKKRIDSLNYIRNLPTFDTITLQYIKERKILHLKKKTKEQIDWELSLLEFEGSGIVSPSVFIGDPGFFVKLKNTEHRKPFDFSGIYMFADEPFLESSQLIEVLPAGNWLTLYIHGNHIDASTKYVAIKEYAKKNNLILGDYALERTLIDHYISSDPNFHITEIQIPII